MVREIQDRIYGAASCVKLDGNPDFVRLCEAYGIPGIKVTDNSGLETAFNAAVRSKGPFLVECIVDPNESTI
jgi:acetolactate synthase-1/2/3 large subunit